MVMTFYKCMILLMITQSLGTREMIIYFTDKVNTQFENPRILQTCVSVDYDSVQPLRR